MKYTYQYRLRPTTEQKVTLNEWLRICRFWYNRQLGERFNWWEQNRCSVNACPLVCHLPDLRERPNYYSQKKQLPILKKNLVTVEWSGEELNFSEVPSLTLQEVCKRVDKAFWSYLSGDSKGKRSGKPRFKSSNRFRSLLFEGGGVELPSCSVGGKYLYLQIPKMGLIKVRRHRYLPNGAILKQAQIIKKADGWYVNLRLDDPTIPEFNPDKIVPSWDNSLGLDAVLYQDDYLAISDGTKLPSLKSLRKSEILIDRDINSSINIKRVGLDEFPTIKRRKGKPIIVDSNTGCTSKEVLSIFRDLEKPAL